MGGALGGAARWQGEDKRCPVPALKAWVHLYIYNVPAITASADRSEGYKYIKDI